MDSRPPRWVRHDVFAKRDADWLARWHITTTIRLKRFLLNLLRGAGIAGAAGMRAERAAVWAEAGSSSARRSRDRYQGLRRQYSLPWIDDESNGDLRYRRNFLRHAVLPPLKVKFPVRNAGLARAADHFAGRGPARRIGGPRPSGAGHIDRPYRLAGVQCAFASTGTQFVTLGMAGGGARSRLTLDG
ncbi:MAG: hypothetical protein IPL29_03870 [Propionivibrio sp.]|nr:hypothetical protein [Propionivibrio sp.]